MLDAQSSCSVGFAKFVPGHPSCDHGQWRQVLEQPLPQLAIGRTSVHQGPLNNLGAVQGDRSESDSNSLQPTADNQQQMQQQQ